MGITINNLKLENIQSICIISDYLMFVLYFAIYFFPYVN